MAVGVQGLGLDVRAADVDREQGGVHTHSLPGEGVSWHGSYPVRMIERDSDRGVVRVEPGARGPHHAQQVDPQQVRHRVDGGVLEVGAGARHVVGSPAGTSPNAHTTRPGAEIEIGPWRNSIAG